MKLKLILASAVLAISSFGVKAQTYADALVSSGPCDPIVALVCPSGVENPGNAVDADMDNYALLKSNLGVSLIESTSFIEVSFSELASPGSEIGLVIQSLNQNVNVDLVNNLTVVLFNEQGGEVLREEALSLQDVGALSGQDSKQIVRVSTPLDSSAVKTVRLELTSVLNVAQDLALYGVYHNASCPPVIAENTGDSQSVNNPEFAVDTIADNFALLSLPIAIGNTAYLDVVFDNPALPGDFVGFEVAKNNTVLSLGLLENINIILYDEDDNVVDSRSDFEVTDLVAVEQLSGVLGGLLGVSGNASTKIIGLTVSSNAPGNVKKARIELAPTIGLFTDLAVYNGFYYSKLTGVKITKDRIGIIGGQSVTLTADPGYDNYTWSNGATGQSITVDAAGKYTVTASRFDACELQGSIQVLDLECNKNGRIYADSVFATGNCDPIIPLLCPSGVQNPEFAVDNDPNSYALMVSQLSVSLIESTSFLDLSFSELGTAGSDVSVLVQAINQNLNADVVDNLTVYVYDENDSIIVKNTSVNLENVGLLSADGGKAVVTVKTPVGDYKIARARIEMVGTVNLAQDLAVYEMFIDCACPPLAANVVNDSGNTTDVDNMTDNDNSNFALMSIPVALAQSAFVDVSYPSNPVSGDFLAFQVAADNDLLSVGLINNINIIGYDTAGNEVFTQSDFELADLVAAEQLGGVVGSLLGDGSNGPAVTILGTEVPFLNGDSAVTLERVVLEVQPIIGLLTNLRIYNSFVISQVTGVKITGTDDRVCEGGDVALTAPAGYTSYTWSNGATGQTINVSSPGLYTVVVDRADGCSLSGSYFLADNSFFITSEVTDANCGESNGSAVAMANGGSGDYSFSWSTGATTDTITDIPSGVYKVTITDNVRGCVESADVAVSDMESANFIGYVKHAECGENNGAIYLTLDSNQTVQWTHGPSSEIIRDLAPGSYTAIVTDDSTCKRIKTFEVISRADFELSATATASLCGGETGSINLTVNGSGDFVYEWSNGATTQDINGLAAGFYTVKVTDLQTGCEDILSATVSDIGAPIVVTGDVNEETCPRDESGSIDLTIISGIPPTVSWNNGDTTEDIENLGPGIYVVEVTAGGCTAVEQFELVARENVEVAFVSTASTCDSTMFDGAVDATVTEGRAPYTYEWDNGATTEDLENVGPGDYALTVTDFNGCAYAPFVVTVDDSGVDTCGTNGGGGNGGGGGTGGGTDDDGFPTDEAIYNGFTPNGDGTNDVWKFVDDDIFANFDNVEMLVVNRFGTMVMQENNYQNDWDGTYRDSNEPCLEGTYFYTATITIDGEDREYKGFVVIER